ncbi:MAG: anthranilate phosphoribosyltransferase [Candidatus Omnitrophota bacterium]|nr:anthranilate phosphoribosyltransferase [Candidatus Omnitrophota bacterium]
MIKEAIIKLACSENLSFGEAQETFKEIFEHKATLTQIAAFLTALKIKGETEEEIYAAATIVRRYAHKIKVRGDFVGIEIEDEPIMDTCGTGGSGVNKFNISTVVAFIVAASGVKVAKHGNRAMSSNCGSADVLEALGIKIDVSPLVMEEAIKKIGIGFLYAPLYHPALKEVAQVRKDLGIRTIFNILGPLCNPASVTHQLLGVYDKDLVLTLAKVLANLKVKKAFVFHGKDLKDEISLTGETFAAFLNNNRIEKLSLRPSEFGLKKVALKDLEVKDVNESAKIINNILDGKYGPTRDIALANASPCFYILGKSKNLKEGARLAASLIDEGKAKNKFLEFKNFIDTHK